MNKYEALQLIRLGKKLERIKSILSNSEIPNDSKIIILRCIIEE